MHAPELGPGPSVGGGAIKDIVSIIDKNLTVNCELDSSFRSTLNVLILTIVLYKRIHISYMRECPCD